MQNGFEIEVLNDKIAQQLENLPTKIKASMYHIFDLLEKYGNEVREPHTKALGGGLYEARAKGLEGIARAFFTYQGKRVIVILHCFIKKSQKTPKNELEKARKILKELQGGTR